MNTLLKIGAGLGIGYLIYWGYTQAKQVAGAFDFNITGYGSPVLNWPNLDLPVNVEFNNPTGVPITLDNVAALIYINKNGWTQVASFSQPMSLPPGKSVQTIKTRIDISQILGGNIWNTLQTALTAYSNKALSVRTDLTVTVKGVNFPTKQFVNQIQVG